MPKPAQSPLNYTPARHALLHQIHTTTGTDNGWTRTPNPAKAKKPDSGLPDHLYDTANPDDRPSSMLQRAVRQLDQNGLLGPDPTDGPDNLDTSPLGQRVLDAWNREFGRPGDPT